MNLLFDLGNTRLKCARLHEGVVDRHAAFAWNDAGFESRLREWLLHVDADPRSPIWLASVAPDVAIERFGAVVESLGLQLPIRVRPQADALGLRVAYAQPQTLGVDRWLGMLAARACSRDATLVVGVGSALTIDAVDAEGRHLGGLIAPPPEAMRAALVARAPRLDVASGGVHRFAASTPDAIASGCLLAAAALIERSHAELALQTSTTPQLLLAGGGAEALREWIPPHRFVPELVLEGLAHWVVQAPR